MCVCTACVRRARVPLEQHIFETGILVYVVALFKQATGNVTAIACAELKQGIIVMYVAFYLDISRKLG